IHLLGFPPKRGQTAFNSSGRRLTAGAPCLAQEAAGSKAPAPQQAGSCPSVSWGASSARGKPSPLAGVLPEPPQLPPRPDSTQPAAGLLGHGLIRQGAEQRVLLCRPGHTSSRRNGAAGLVTVAACLRPACCTCSPAPRLESRRISFSVACWLGEDPRSGTM